MIKQPWVSTTQYDYELFSVTRPGNLYIKYLYKVCK